MSRGAHGAMRRNFRACEPHPRAIARRRFCAVREFAYRPFIVGVSNQTGRMANAPTPLDSAVAA
jgi:hypothetical protein